MLLAFLKAYNRYECQVLVSNNQWAPNHSESLNSHIKHLFMQFYILLKIQDFLKYIYIYKNIKKAHQYRCKLIHNSIWHDCHSQKGETLTTSAIRCHYRYIKSCNFHKIIRPTTILQQNWILLILQMVSR